MKRVVITGMGMISPLGPTAAATMGGLAAHASGVRAMTEWTQYQGLRSRVGAPAELLNEKAIPRQLRRSMGRLSIFAVQAASQAVADAGLVPEALIHPRTGCMVGSTMGSAGSITEAYELMLPAHDISQLPSTKFFQCVSHTAAMNVSTYLGIRGTVMAPSSACASGLQAVGTAYEWIRAGLQDVIVCGGAEELHPTVVGSFDVLFAASASFNDSPTSTPRPFDQRRDGLVCGEGAGILVLEDYEHAVRRGAPIIAEVIGYHTCGGGDHVSQSNREAMRQCMIACLDSASLPADAIDYLSAHATATPQGDAQEAAAIHDVFGARVPVSSLKGHFGHTLGASGPIELIATLHMMRLGVLYPTRNLEHIANDCQGINLFTEARPATITTFMKNNFAFGGINAALICQRPS